MDTSRIAAVPLIADLSAAELDELAAAMSGLEVEAGAKVISLDNYGTAIYFIEQGHADVLPDGGQTTQTLGPGDTFGEIAVLLTGERTASVVARTPMRLLSLSGQDFERIRTRVPELERSLRRLAVERVGRASLVQVAQAGPSPRSVPDPIQVLDGSKVFLIGHAVGVQIYSCNGTGWSFVAPRANLFDDQGELIITHFAGPTWQAKDGSMVVGHAEASVSVDPTAIPGVRLSAASTTPGQLREHHQHPTNRNHRRARSPCRRLQRDKGGNRGRGLLHRRLLLLEVNGPDTTQFAALDLVGRRRRSRRPDELGV